MDTRIIDSLFTSQKFYFKSGKTLDYKFRKKMLQKLKKEILFHRDDIADALYKDLSKSEAEIITTEIGAVLNEIKHTLKKLKKWMGNEKKPSNILNFPSKSFVMKEPYGTVLIISPWNYPFQLTFTPLVGAIAAGNCAIIKPSELSPNVSCIIEKIISRCFPKEYISVIQGDAPTAEHLLSLNFDMIFFTGSTTVGKIVMKKASENLTPVVLELGGKSPCIVHKSADVKTAAAKIAFGKTINSGQTCIAPDYLILHKDLKDEFIREYSNALRAFYGSDVHRSCDYGRIINLNHFERLLSYLRDGKLIHGGNYLRDKLYIEPTLLLLDKLDVPIMEEEIFGPILPIILYTNPRDICSIVNMNPNPLALYIFSTDDAFTTSMLREIPAGGCCVNDTIMHLTNENLPFGGRGNSGMGRYHGKYSFDTFSHEKSVLMKKEGMDLKEKYPPYTTDKLKLIKKIFKVK